MRGLAAIFAALLSLIAASAEAQPRPRVTGLAFTVSDGRTEVRISIDKHLTYNVFLLTEGGPRVVVDLPLVRWSLGGLTAESGAGPGRGLVSRFRYAHSGAATSRIVFDLSGPASIGTIRAVTHGEGHEIVIPLISVGSAAPARVTAIAKPTAVKPSKKVVVIDPGHGGKDPGAIAASGAREKDITLAAAQALKTALRRTGRYEVVLTRAGDEFIELDDRVTRARELGADLFISLHADAGRRNEVRGASIYTLSREGEKRAETARKQNDWVLAVETDTSRPAAVNQVLADLVQRETKNQSARFAELLAASLAKQGWPTLENTHRRKGFFVLLSPDVPAVLLEMGFLTNPEDAAMLSSDKRRQKLVDGVVRAIDAFFDDGRR
jgi:N-acetylmuramoyl-L-alanine amidase